MSDRKNNILYIHQALHGYFNGHRLLKSSCSFSRETERIMLMLSDLSGSSIYNGFESYLTGYFLPNADLYAIARTWYAEEMERPGCVWTHTLFIEYADVERIQDIGSLLRLFVRPQKDQLLSYGSRISIPVNNMNEPYLKEYHFSKSDATSILTALYESPDKPVFIPANSTEKYEKLILAIWNQQWPRLRRSFCFCTGSLSNRKFNQRPFDLQIIPFNLIDHIRREIPFGVFLSFDRKKYPSHLPLWVSNASIDLFTEDKNPLRDFLWDFGEEIPKGRAGFASLFEISSSIEKFKLGEISLNKLIEIVAKLFPRPEDIPLLKGRLFGSYTSNVKQLLHRINESDLIKELTTTKYYTAFDTNALDIRLRAKALLKSEPLIAQNLILELVNTNLNPLGEEFLAGISEVLEVEDAIKFSKKSPNLLYVFIYRNPRLATSPMLWHLSQNQQRKMFDAIADCKNLSKDIIKGIIATMVEEGSDVMAEHAVNLFREEAINGVLDWFNTIDTSTPRKFSHGWRNALQSQPLMLLKWLKGVKSPNAVSIALLASLLNPNSSEVQKFGTKIWLCVTNKTTFSDLDRRTLIDTMSFMLVLGFNNPDDQAYKLVTLAFQIVHDAVEKDELGYENWLLLKDKVPSLWWWRDWDKCERLRRALVEKFIHYNWPPDQFLQAIKRDDTFRQVVEYCRDTNQGIDLLRRAADQIGQGKVHITNFREKILDKYLVK